jgi:small-conductance mechanosensitive channel
MVSPILRRLPRLTALPLLCCLLAGLGIGGIAFALAAKDTVENLFGSVTVLVDRPFQVGDWVVIGDQEGTVEEIGFRSMRLRTFYNSRITIPNSLLVKSAVDNLGARRYRRVKCMIGVQYDTPPDRIEAFCEGIRELIRRHPAGLCRGVEPDGPGRSRRRRRASGRGPATGAGRGPENP